MINLVDYYYKKNTKERIMAKKRKPIENISKKFPNARALSVHVGRPVTEVVDESISIQELARDLKVDGSSIFYRIKRYGYYVWPGMNEVGNICFFVYNYKKLLEEHPELLRRTQPQEPNWDLAASTDWKTDVQNKIENLRRGLDEVSEILKKA